MQKRSLKIAGHSTSIALEPGFWDALGEMARVRETTIPQLIEAIDQSRETPNLSSAIRLAVLDFYRNRTRPL